MARPTLHDVAAKGGISLTTASMVLGGKDSRISPKTRERVLEAAAALGYERNLVASALRTGIHDYFLILMANQDRPITRSLLLDNPFFADFVAGLEYAAASRNAHFAFRRLAEASELHDIYSTRRPRGTLVIGRIADELIDEIGRWEVPTVIVDDIDTCAKLRDNTAVIDFSLDDFRMGYIGMEHLIGLGHRRIALLFGRLSDSSVHRERYRGVRQAMLDHGLTGSDVSLIETETISYAAAQSCADVLERELAAGTTAILCMADILAVGCHAMLTQRGRNIPRDVSLCGMDRLCLIDYMPYRLTTVDQGIVARGAAALDIALGLPITAVLEPHIFPGETTAPAAALR